MFVSCDVAEAPLAHPLATQQVKSVLLPFFFPLMLSDVKYKLSGSLVYEYAPQPVVFQQVIFSFVPSFLRV